MYVPAEGRSTLTLCKLGADHDENELIRGTNFCSTREASDHAVFDPLEIEPTTLKHGLDAGVQKNTGCGSSEPVSLIESICYQTSRTSCRTSFSVARGSSSEIHRQSQKLRSQTTSSVISNFTQDIDTIAVGCIPAKKIPNCNEFEEALLSNCFPEEARVAALAKIKESSVVLEVRMEKESSESVGTLRSSNDEESGIFSADSSSSSASKSSDLELTKPGKRKAPNSGGQTRKIQRGAKKAVPLPKLVSQQCQISVAKPKRSGNSSPSKSTAESSLTNASSTEKPRRGQKRSLVRDSAGSVQNWVTLLPIIPKRTRTSSVTSLMLESHLVDGETNKSLEIGENDTTVSSKAGTQTKHGKPKLALSVGASSSKIDKRKKKPNIKDVEQYEPDKYPMEKLAKEAFVVEATAKKVCHICLDNKYEDTIEGCLLACCGPCKRIVHIQCLKPGVHIPALSATPENESTIAVYRELLGDAVFQCEECRTGYRECFLCEGKGNGLIKCPEGSCGHFYHRKCLLGPLADEKTKLKPCPCHECHTCKRNSRQAKDKTVAKTLSQCALCPVAFHFNFMCFPTEASICIDNPSYNTCWKHAEKSPANKNKIDSKICFYCHDGGQLLMCQSCPLTAHAECVWLDEIPEGDWHCQDCVKESKPAMLDIVWYKCGVHRPWPCQIVPPSLAPESVRNKCPEYGYFILRFLGTKDHDFAQSRDVMPYDICDPSWKKNPDKTKGFREGLEEAKRISNEMLKIKGDFAEKHFVGVQQSFNKIRANKAIPPAVYGAAFKKEDVDICSCKETDPDPCGPTSNCLNRSTENECHPKFCPAGNKCKNQRLRKRQYPKLKVFYTVDRGWALKTMEDLKKGDLVIEYVGEIITVEERNARIRNQLASGNVNFYYLDLTNNRVIDAGPSGNDARFANHSCNANASSQKWIVDGETRIALIAIKDIKNGEEISFDYRWEYESGVTSRECLCRAENCLGKIGGKEKRSNLSNSKVSEKKSIAAKKRKSSTLKK